MKMHLPGRVPNEGARRLAWWIGRECGGDLSTAAERLGSSTTMLQRVLEGAILPAEELAERIGRGTRDAIGPRDWRHAPQGGWFDLPIERAAA